MLGEIDGNARRRRSRGCVYAVVPLGILDAFFNIANGRQVFIEFAPVVSSQGILQPLCVVEHQVQQAFAILRLSLPFGWILLLVRGTEYPLENSSRADLRRIWRILRTPGNAVAVR